ncbi:MFS transporter [Methanobacterium ferruginis]|uniref:MFS transporter n=1 Tax=Methanobacterium ferruginis TaxID=710191 RepID=UPI002572C214|nr:MFS transporter [Methanobacterium ferruginis]BDZ66739.1 MFS transporter [Methanobacterium ferruginis]
MLESLRDNQKLTLLVISLANFMSFLDISIVNVSLPTMAKYFGVTTNDILWTILIYIIVLGSFLIVFGKLAQQKGFKKVFLTGFVIFIVGSSLSGISTQFHELILFRLVQAFGAAMFSAITAAMVLEYLPENKRGRNLGIVTTIGSLGLALGPLLGGFITEYINFHWIFFINIPIGIIGIILGHATLHETRKHPGSLDLVGVTMFFIAQSTLIFALNKGLDYGWTSAIILGSFICSIIFWVLFVLQESRAGEPLINLNYLKMREIALASSANILSNMPFAGAVVLLPFYFEVVKGMSTSHSGLMLTLMPIAIFIVGPLAGTISDKIAPNRVTLMGAVIGVIGCVVLSTFNPSSSFLYIAIGLLILGASVAAFNPPNTKFILSESPSKYRGIASGLVNTSNMLGNGFGTGILGTVAAMVVYNTVGPSTSDKLSPVLVSQGLHNAFLVGAVAMGIALILIAMTKYTQPEK